MVWVPEVSWFFGAECHCVIKTSEEVEKPVQLDGSATVRDTHSVTWPFFISKQIVQPGK